MKKKAPRTGSLGLLDLFRSRRRSQPAQPSPTTVSSELQPEPAPFTERRQHARRYGDPVQVLLWDGIPGSKPLQAWVLDRSAGGLGLSVPQSIMLGWTWSVRVALAPDSVPWTLVEMKHCRASAGRWIVGCQFVMDVPMEVLLLFR